MLCTWSVAHICLIVAVNLLLLYQIEKVRSWPVRGKGDG